jgi:hypothetical protein
MLMQHPSLSVLVMPCLPEFFSAQGIFCTLLPAQPPILFLPSWVRSAGTGVLQVLSLGSYKIHGKSRSQLQKIGVFMWSLLAFDKYSVA